MRYNEADLLRLDQARNREVFVRITSLDRYERPIETIEGKTTGGSINVDGNSAVRRSCSLTMVAKDVTIHNVYWGLKTKVKIEVGVRNMMDGPNSTIYWFKAGIYVLTDFRVQQSVNNFTISLSGKDKMCLLNGEVGGNFMAMTDLGQIQETGEDGVTLTALKISTIVKEMLIGIGGELPQNIILNNVDDYGVELLTYKGDKPLFLIFKEANRQGLETCLGEAEISGYKYKGETISRLIDYAEIIPPISSLSLSDFSFDADYNFIITKDNENYGVFKIETNHVCGYRITELTYPGGELIAQVGEAVTTILDKLKNQFGTFEYFYDLDGHFIFQLKPIYSNTSYNTRTDYTQADTQSYVESPYNLPKYSYYFNDNNLLTALNNSPSLGSIKNDFAIWGTNANDLPIHLRYAIDRKPEKYVTYDGVEYQVGQLTDEDKDSISGINFLAQELIASIKTNNTTIQDLENKRALLMGKIDSGSDELPENWEILIGDETVVDSYKYQIKELQDANTSFEAQLKSYDETKAVMFRTACDWREIIYQMACDWFNYYHHGGVTSTASDNFIQVLQKRNAKHNQLPQLKLYGRTGYEQYYTDIQGFWRQIYNPDTFTNSEDFDIYTGFNKMLEEDPEELKFYFDFLDADSSDVGAYSVPYIGARTKTSNNSAIKVIKYEEVPNIIFLGTDVPSQDEQVQRLQEGYYGIWLEQDIFDKYIDLAARNKSCYDELDNLLYNYTYINQSISLTTIPIYRLEPNTLIYIKDETNDINGEYSINRMTIPLTYNGTMSITANRVPQRLY